MQTAASSRLALDSRAPRSRTRAMNSSAIALNQSGCAEPSDSGGGYRRRSARPSAVRTSVSSSISIRPAVPMTRAWFSRVSAAQVSTMSATASGKCSRTVAVSSTAKRRCRRVSRRALTAAGRAPTQRGIT
jgi:hypothetical protein